MKIVALNLKMNFDLNDAKTYAESLEGVVTGNPRVLVFPSFPLLTFFNSKKYETGSQDISEYLKGSYTSSVSASQVASCGATWTIINHSERKLFQKETDDILATKIRNALTNNLKVIFCIGESSEDKKEGRTEFMIRRKINHVLGKFNKEELSKMIVAYEPEWAIGSGKTPTNDEISKMADLIKKEIANMSGLDMPILYGGSINSYNISLLNTISNIDGFLVGKASLDIRSLEDIIKTSISNI